MTNPIDITTPAAFEQACAEVDSQMGGLEPVTVPFRHLPLGARFRYTEHLDVFVVLERHGCGKVADWEGNTLQNPFQGIYNAANSDAECEALRVILLPDHTQ